MIKISTILCDINEIYLKEIIEKNEKVLFEKQIELLDIFREGIERINHELFTLLQLPVYNEGLEDRIHYFFVGFGLLDGDEAELFNYITEIDNKEIMRYINNNYLSFRGGDTGIQDINYIMGIDLKNRIINLDIIPKEILVNENNLKNESDIHLLKKFFDELGKVNLLIYSFINDYKSRYGFEFFYPAGFHYSNPNQLELKLDEN